jgi:hypothetical protein
MMRFSDLSEQEILALAISSEEEDTNRRTLHRLPRCYPYWSARAPDAAAM